MSSISGKVIHTSMSSSSFRIVLSSSNKQKQCRCFSNAAKQGIAGSFAKPLVTCPAENA